MQIQNTHVNYLVTAVCAVAAVWFGAQLTWQVITPATPVASGPLSVSATQSERQASAQSLIALDLFGTPPVSQVAASNAPKTSLNIRLLGVSASNVPERSAAIIERSGQQEVYVMGEKLNGTQVVIKEIYADRVILDNNGRLETLELEGIGELSEGLSLTMANSRGAGSGSGSGSGSDGVSRSARAVDAGAGSAGAGGAGAGNGGASGSEVLENASPEVREVADNLLQHVKITPVRSGNGLAGYRLSPGANPELFNKAGFRDGDLAVAINGEDLTRVSTAMKLMRDLGSMTEATITVERNNQYTDLRLDIRDLEE
ncbi:type II secretion system protein GspC [Pseudidiomarina woesei]|uniref:Type II secretion system protein C (GspC) n=1 Tax=Pseudidiomarina woesei TaxID=1381080 RepID=A0A0K6H6J2_9GAMM|nr:type II secretion system protein GspC [Pseudidiomarina woesei]CUA86528.1 type II secretion system protein C (GspC) [Pseudidiomarina woesei]